MRQFVIADIHGCNTTFLALLDKISFSTTDELYLLGDYIDRGPDSLGVLETILRLKNTGYSVHCLRGNHEQMFLDAPDKADYYNQWAADKETKWFGFSKDRYIPALDAAQMAFLEHLPFVLEVGCYILVHGGLNFNQDNPLLPTHQMMWLRYWYDKINYTWLSDRYILHGHTPVKGRDMALMHAELEVQRVLNLDNGCVFTSMGLGHLACFELGSQSLIFQKNIEKNGLLW